MWKEVPRTRKKEVLSSHHVESSRPSLTTVSLRSVIFTMNDTICDITKRHLNHPKTRIIEDCVRIVTRRQMDYARATLDKKSCVITSTLFEMNSTCMRWCDLNFSCLSTSITSAEVSMSRQTKVSKSNMADRVYISCLQTFIL